ncbi:MAG: GPO family capsid scaffolding protein [Burkholderiaceae bacterium]
MPKSKFFRVAVEGATTDGRTIQREWISQMAKNFDPKKYGARIWMEHLRGLMPDGPFKAYGDVVALKAGEAEIDGKKKQALFAQVEPLPELVEMNKKRQKIYTSIEVDPDFSDSGEAYLIGLGVTDSPASLGTDVLTFAAQHPDASPFTGRKQKKENLFTVAVETEIEFEEDAPAVTEELGKLTQRVKDLMAKFTGKKAGDDNRFTELTEAVGGMIEAVEAIGKQSESFAAASALTELQAKHDKLASDFSAMREQLGKEADDAPRRPAATGADAGQTDC